MRMCHAVTPMMLESGGGAIINFSSTYGNGTNLKNAINFVPVTYSTAKAAIRGFTTTLARDLAPEIRVNALAPRPDLGGMGDRVGSLARAHRRGNRHEPAEAFRQARGDRRNRPVLGFGRGRVHHRSGDPRGWRLGGSALERALLLSDDTQESLAASGDFGFRIDASASIHPSTLLVWTRSSHEKAPDASFRFGRGATGFPLLLAACLTMEMVSGSGRRWERVPPRRRPRASTFVQAGKGQPRFRPGVADSPRPLHPLLCVRPSWPARRTRSRQA
jgi:hypothetical protein